MSRYRLWMQMGVVLGLLSACSEASFAPGAGGKRGGPDAVPAKSTGGQQNPRKEPLDISKIPNNVDLAEAGGPKPAPGGTVSRTAALGCDAQTGAIIDVGPNGVQGQGSNLLGNPTAPIVIGKDGKPIGPISPSAPSDPSLPTVPPIAVTPSSKVAMTIKGKFCPETKNRLTVLFVVDFSGSMGHHLQTPSNRESLGNDPLTAGSCGRLRAAQALLNKIKSEKAAQDEVMVGMVPFAGGILTERLISLRSLEEFAATATVDNLCSFVVQEARQVGRPDYPGGVTSPGVDASTNYRAAFTAAQSLLQGVYGKKQLYFVSDGEPTSGGQDPIAAGVTAGESLRQTVDNITMNALILGNVPTAQTVLERVVGSAERVKTADTADQLAEKILDFPPPSIDESTGRATLAVLPYNPADLGLQSLVRDPASRAIWTWETQPFYLVGKPGEEVINEVVVTAQGRDGSTYKSQVRVRYRP
jgi:hypothetical protein